MLYAKEYISFSGLVEQFRRNKLRLAIIYRVNTIKKWWKAWRMKEFGFQLTAILGGKRIRPNLFDFGNDRKNPLLQK